LLLFPNESKFGVSQSYENRVQNKGNLFLFYAEMHELRDFLSQSYEKSFRFLQTLCGKDAVRM